VRGVRSLLQLTPGINNQEVKIVTVNFVDPAICSRQCPNSQYIIPDASEQQRVITRKTDVERNSTVGLATCYRLGGPGIESRWTARFSAPVQTGPGAHPASCTTCTGSLSRELSGRGVALNIHPHLAPRLKKEYSCNSTPSGTSPPVRGWTLRIWKAVAVSNLTH